MREIMYRGKIGEMWLYGYYIVNQYNEHTICSEKGAFKVIPESVGQLVQRRKNVTLWEGDIVIPDDGGEYFLTEYDEAKDEIIPHSGKYVIVWDEKFAGFVLKDAEGKIPDIEYCPFTNDGIKFTVVGNQFENPELLKGGER